MWKCYIPIYGFYISLNYVYRSKLTIESKHFAFLPMYHFTTLLLIVYILLYAIDPYRLY